MHYIFIRILTLRVETKVEKFTTECKKCKTLETELKYDSYFSILFDTEQ